MELKLPPPLPHHCPIIVWSGRYMWIYTHLSTAAQINKWERIVCVCVFAAPYMIWTIPIMAFDASRLNHDEKKKKREKSATCRGTHTTYKHMQMESARQTTKQQKINKIKRIFFFRHTEDETHLLTLPPHPRQERELMCWGNIHI